MVDPVDDCRSSYPVDGKRGVVREKRTYNNSDFLHFNPSGETLSFLVYICHEFRYCSPLLCVTCCFVRYFKITFKLSVSLKLWCVLFVCLF